MRRGIRSIAGLVAGLSTRVQEDSTPTTKAAPQQEVQEPFAWHVCSVNKDGSLSLEHAAAWEEAAHEHINDAITEHFIVDAASWVVRPAYHAPQPAPVAQGDAEDAARYRRLRECNSGSLVVAQITGTGEEDWRVLTERDADEAIDAEINAARSQAKEGGA